MTEEELEELTRKADVKQLYYAERLLNKLVDQQLNSDAIKDKRAS